MADPYSNQRRYQGQYGASSGPQQSYGYPTQPTQMHNQPSYSQELPSTSYQQGGYPQEYEQYGGPPPQYGSQPGAYPQQGVHQAQSHAQGGAIPDALMSDFATGMLRQQGENYFQRGQAFVQSKMGFLSSNNLQYYFSVDTGYVRDKLFLLLLPFLKQWSFSRKPEQVRIHCAANHGPISGGHRYQPPRQDTFAPDLYIPFMAMCTYVVLVSVAQTAAGKFTHDNVYVTVSGTLTAWFAHWLVIKLVLYMLGIPSAVPFLENLALAGYPFVYACLGTGATLLGGLWPYRAVLIYGGLAMGTFIVRTLKRVLFHDSPHFSGRARLNYLLLGLALFQFPFLAWLYVKPQ